MSFKEKKPHNGKNGAPRVSLLHKAQYASVLCVTLFVCTIPFGLISFEMSLIAIGIGVSQFLLTLLFVRKSVDYRELGAMAIIFSGVLLHNMSFERSNFMREVATTIQYYCVIFFIVFFLTYLFRKKMRIGPWT